ncbi:HhH-GPD superfamily base excision DNA repair protein [Pleurostoma richardsiae]|uniref:HhH-GPD superfamily base excision DNA repair protein n=1 Tax=Pleurostoma richardsiae TaxID=41990 RepID=A0AA38VW95_9PEZI|nr:HhH-GPD superfamily base excision DNA repair protein [Pleurostoma richardsiae]
MAARRSARLSAQASDKAAGTSSTEPMPPPPPPPTKSRKRKSPASNETANGTAPAPPTTPQKRRAPRATAPPPATPTPSAVGLIAETAAVKAPRTPRHKTVDRLADPNATNAPLLSPETSRLVARPPVESVSPSKVSAPRTTTANILEEACRHLVNVDPRMKRLVEAHHCRIFSPEGLAEEIDPFESLASGIISQQVSGAAARAIKARFVALFDDEDGGDEVNGNGATAASDDNDEEAAATPRKKRFPHPSSVAATPLETLRTAGLSQRKAEYVQGLAAKFASGELSARLLADAPYEEVLERLTAVRGLGRWSVEMFACFGLKRMDVFSLGDLGVQRGMAAFVGRDVARLKAKGGKWKYMSEAEMEEIAARFAPYRSVFMWYMWRVEETDVSTLE